MLKKIFCQIFCYIVINVYFCSPKRKFRERNLKSLIEILKVDLIAGESLRSINVFSMVAVLAKSDKGTESVRRRGFPIADRTVSYRR